MATGSFVQLQNAYLPVVIGIRGTDGILIPTLSGSREQSNQPRPADLQQTTTPENRPLPPQIHIDVTRAAYVRKITGGRFRKNTDPPRAGFGRRGDLIDGCGLPFDIPRLSS